MIKRAALLLVLFAALAASAARSQQPTGKPAGSAKPRTVEDSLKFRPSPELQKSLEELAASKPGVEKVYALQAGREIRVIVKPGEVDDDTAALLSHEIAREIEDQLEYPGQVKVTVIRESRAIDVARNHAALQNPDEDTIHAA